MKDIFIYSDAITARTIAYQIRYVLSFDIDSVILLKENHGSNEKDIAGYGVEVLICDSIEACLACCDTVFVSTNMKHSIKSFYGKSVIYVKAFDGFRVRKKLFLPKWDYTHKPVIAILSLGYFADIYYTEIMVNKILSEVGASVAQSFSVMTKLMLDSLKRQISINPNVIQHSDGDVIVVSLDGTGGGYGNLVNVLSKLSPDLFIVCVNRSYKNDDEFMQSFKYVKSIDIVIRSPYILYEVIPGKILPVFCDVNHIEDIATYSVSYNSYNALRELILNRLYWPKDINLLQ